MSWIENTLDANKSSPHPTATQINSFFDYQPDGNHPFLSSEFQEELDLHTHSRLTANNQISLLPNAQSSKLKYELIRKAKKSIWIATFQIVCDEGGKAFTDELIRAAKRGIEVRFLLTGGPWTWAFSGNCPNLMRERKVQAATMPYSYITNHGVVQLHDKIFIVDEHTAIVGGQNIGSWYSKREETDGKFRDTDALISGPVTEDILKRFVVLWHLAKPNDRSLKLPDTKATPEHYSNWLKTMPTAGLCRFVSQTPSNKDYSVFEAYRLYAFKTQQRIIFHSLTLNGFGSPEQENLLQAFTHVSQKPGGEVFLLTNGPGFLSSKTTPRWIGKLVGYYFLRDVYRSLKGNQIEAFAYPSWLHSKVYFFDNFATAIGSFNFDETGLVWTESSLICLDTKLASEVKTMFQEDLKDSYLLTKP
ncbi:MAG: phosphatidylserine/phosphatidylglycerophosphate/cardiolipin synthase family protein [Myxococcaceae bacterium]